MPNKKITKKKVSKEKVAKKKAAKKKANKKKASKQKSVEVATEGSSVPASLLKLGITKVTDNIPDGGRLDVNPDTFMSFFGNALLEHYSKKSEHNKK